MFSNLIHFLRLTGTGVILTTIILGASQVVPLASANGDALGDASEITGIDDTEGDIEGTIINVVVELLKLVALIATIVVIAAGVYLVAGAGSDSSREKAKNMIIYTLVGILVILLAGAFVTLIISAGGG